MAGELEELDPIRERILAAARRVLLEHGLSRTSLADIARAAGVSEATLYRRFSGRDELLSTLVHRESNAFIAELDERVGGIEDPVEQLVAGFVLLCQSVGRHELVQRLMATDPQLTLPLLTAGGGPWIAIAREYVAGQIRKADPATLTAAPEHIAELFVRIAHSLLLTPDTALPVDDEEQLADFARATLAPLALVRPTVKKTR